MTEQEFLDDRKTAIVIESPFSEIELTETILKHAVSKSYSALNMYKPKTIRSTSLISLPGYKLIRSYTNEYDTNSIIPFIEEYDSEIGRVHVYSKPWTFEELQNDYLAFKYFKDLTFANACMFMANNRRSTEMSGVPFSLKGDQFYEEAKRKKDSIEEELINTTTNTL